MDGGVRKRVTDRPRSELGPSIDTLFGLLSDRRVRFTLYYQLSRRGPVPLEELAEHVAAWERELDGTVRIDEEEIRQQLHDAVLPRIREAGLIEYDADLRMAEFTGEYSVIEPVLDSARHQEWFGPA